MTRDQFAQVPVWLDKHLRLQFSHPASYGRAVRGCLVLLAAMKEGKTTRPVRIGALAHKHGMDARKLRKAFQVLEEAGVVRRHHQSRGNLRSASHYVMAMSREEVGELAACDCWECLRRQGRMRPGRDANRAASGPGQRCSDVVLQNDDGDEAYAHEPSEKELLNEAGAASAPTVDGSQSDAADVTPPLRKSNTEGGTHQSGRPSKHSSGKFQMQLGEKEPPILTHLLDMLIAADDKTLPVAGRVRRRFQDAFAECPHGTAWVMRRAVQEADTNVVGYADWHVREGTHRVHVRMPVPEGASLALLCGECIAGLCEVDGRVVNCAQCDGAGWASWSNVASANETMEVRTRGERWLDALAPSGVRDG
jgi:predicted transcriptional regulator